MCKFLDESIDEMSVSALSIYYVVHVNIVSLLKNYDKLELFLSQLPRQIDIKCLNETRLTPDKIAKLLKQVYFSMVCPPLQYAVTSWRKAMPTYTDKAQVQQN